MSDPMMRVVRVLGERRILFALLFLAIGVVGLVDVRYGDWRAGPGVGSYLVPMLAYGVIVLCALPILALRAIARGEDDAEVGIRFWPIVLTAAWSVAFFLSVLYVGLAVSSFCFLALAVVLLSPRTGHPPWSAVGVSAVAAVTFWVLFTLLAPIITPAQILF